MFIMYLPLAYINRYSLLTELYCDEEHLNCNPEMLIEMTSDDNWGTDLYSGPNRERYMNLYNMFDRKFFSMHAVSACCAAAGFTGVWKNNKMVYEPDYEFSQALLETNKLRVYPEMIKHIPFNTFYLDFSKNALFTYEGFFVQVKVYDTGAIRISSLPTEKNYSHIPALNEGYEESITAYADSFFIESEMLNVENDTYYFDYDLNKDFMQTSDSFKTQWFIGGLSNFRLFLLQFLMYLSSKEPDINESPDTINTYRPSSVIRNKYSEIRKWEVGVRYGEKIRQFKRNKLNVVGEIEGSNQNAKRPHIRKAHWERYHVGKGRKEIVSKWKEPVFVNGDTDDVITNIHIVTDKDPSCSSGEDMVKEYLKSQNIEFYFQHYVREIRKWYDFSIEWNNRLVFIEFDGEQHFKVINRWKGKKGYLDRRKADIEKNEYCYKNEIPLLRIRFDQAHIMSDMIKDFLEDPTKYYSQFNTYFTNEEYYSICEKA